MKLVSRSVMIWTELPDVYTHSKSAPSLASVVKMLLVISIAHLRQCHDQLQHSFVQFLIGASSDLFFFTHRSRMGICARRSVDPEHLYPLLLLLPFIFFHDPFGMNVTLLLASSHSLGRDTHVADRELRGAFERRNQLTSRVFCVDAQSDNVVWLKSRPQGKIIHLVGVLGLE